MGNLDIEISRSLTQHKKFYSVIAILKMGLISKVISKMLDNSIFLTRCQGKSQCTFASNNNIGGDPCYGTYKYTDVSYKCIEGKYSEFHHFLT